jgi:hypothetical protein
MLSLRPLERANVNHVHDLACLPFRIVRRQYPHTLHACSIERRNKLEVCGGMVGQPFLELYWRRLSALQKILLWTGLLAFAITPVILAMASFVAVAGH